MYTLKVGIISLVIFFPQSNSSITFFGVSFGNWASYVLLISLKIFPITMILKSICIKLSNIIFMVLLISPPPFITYPEIFIFCSNVFFLSVFIG